jgi:hypothetical protein
MVLSFVLFPLPQKRKFKPKKTNPNDRILLDDNGEEIKISIANDEESDSDDENTHISK